MLVMRELDFVHDARILKPFVSFQKIVVEIKDHLLQMFVFAVEEAFCHFHVHFYPPIRLPRRRGPPLPEETICKLQIVGCNEENEHRSAQMKPTSRQ